MQAKKRAQSFVHPSSNWRRCGSSAQNTALQPLGLNWNKIAADLHDPNSAVAKAEDGEANYITAAICKMTNNQPASACTTVVKSIESQI